MKYFKYTAFLRGINVGGHHKVPMAELRKEMEKNGFINVLTLLNTGNIIFEADNNKVEDLGVHLKDMLEEKFGFAIPVLLRKAEDVQRIIERQPFKHIISTKDTRLYVSFLKYKSDVEIELPWTSPDQSYQIIGVSDRTIYSVLDVSKGKTAKGMEALEKLFGKDITTRNWNTLVKIASKL